jgi:hypothetical protein
MGQLAIFLHQDSVNFVQSVWQTYRPCKCAHMLFMRSAFCTDFQRCSHDTALIAGGSVTGTLPVNMWTAKQLTNKRTHFYKDRGHVKSHPKFCKWRWTVKVTSSIVPVYDPSCIVTVCAPLLGILTIGNCTLLEYIASYTSLGIAAAMTSFCLWYSSQIWNDKGNNVNNSNLAVLHSDLTHVGGKTYQHLNEPP